MELSKDIIEAIVDKTLEKFLAGPLGELREGQKALATRMDRLEAKIDRLELRVDQLAGEVLKNSERISSLETRLSMRIDALGARLDARLDETNSRLDLRIDKLGGRLGEMTREQARLADEMGQLKTDRAVTADILQRLSRVEDKLYT